MRLILFLLSLTTIKVTAQFDVKAYSVNSEITDTLFTQSDSVYNPMTLVYTDSLGVLHFDNVLDSNKYAVGSTCLINGDPWSTFLFTNCQMKDEVLLVEIYEGNPAESKSIHLYISKDSFYSTFFYDTPVPVQRSFEVLNQQLVLKNKLKLKEGRWIYGFIELEVKMTEEFDGVKDEVKLYVAGYFKCRIIE